MSEADPMVLRMLDPLIESMTPGQRLELIRGIRQAADHYERQALEEIGVAAGYEWAMTDE